MHVLIADSHPLFRKALTWLIKEQIPAARVTEASCMQSLQSQLVDASDNDLLIMDLDLPGSCGFTGLIHVGACHPALAILAISVDGGAGMARHALMHGALAYLPKSAAPTRFEEAIRHVLAGECWLPSGLPEKPLYCQPEYQSEITRGLRALSPRRYRILMMVANGMLNKQIAYELGLAESTIKAHVSAIMKLLKVRNRTQIVIAASTLHPPAIRTHGPHPNINAKQAS